MEEAHTILKNEGKKHHQCIRLKKKDRNKKRSCSEERHLNIGNCQKKFCSYCRPTLASRLTVKQYTTDEVKYSTKVEIPNNQVIEDIDPFISN